MALHQYPTLGLVIPNFICPRCGDRSHPNSVAGCHEPAEQLKGGHIRCKLHVLVECSCGGVSYLELEGATIGSVLSGGILEHPTVARHRMDVWISACHPLPQPVAIPEHLPDHIAQDARDVAACFAAGIWKSTVSAARRTLQNVAYDKNAPRSVNLADQLQHLKDNDYISEGQREAAMAIKDLGDAGAHPARWDPAVDIVRVDAHDAQWAMETTFQILNHLYSGPKKLDEIRGKMQNRHATDQQSNPSVKRAKSST